jgi:hypothetical protein
MISKTICLVGAVAAVGAYYQYTQFKKCLDAVYLNFPTAADVTPTATPGSEATSPTPNATGQQSGTMTPQSCGEMITNPNGTFAIRVKKFPFSATVLIGANNNTL